ncbi:MAG: 50S ribosomal protein L28 [Dehalococcoidia bacterium]|nr:50S ribosomal protein L28 [Dehalococcoidia bacterium]
MKCEVCGKTLQFGHNISHSNRHTKRKWLPNIQKASLMIDGEKKQISICTRCLRSQYKVRA